MAARSEDIRRPSRSALDRSGMDAFCPSSARRQIRGSPRSVPAAQKEEGRLVADPPSSHQLAPGPVGPSLLNRQLLMTTLRTKR
jgi:hypothetical protein